MFCLKKLHEYSSPAEASLCVAFRNSLPVLVVGVVTTLLAKRFFSTAASIAIAATVSSGTLLIIVLQNLVLRHNSQKKWNYMLNNEELELRLLRPDANSELLRKVAKNRVDRALI